MTASQIPAARAAMLCGLVASLGALVGCNRSENAAKAEVPPPWVTVAPPAYPGIVGVDPAFAPAFENTGGYLGGAVRLADGRIIAFGSFTRGINPTATIVASLCDVSRLLRSQIGKSLPH